MLGRTTDRLDRFRPLFSERPWISGDGTRVLCPVLTTGRPVQVGGFMAPLPTEVSASSGDARRGSNDARRGSNREAKQLNAP